MVESLLCDPEKFVEFAAEQLEALLATLEVRIKRGDAAADSASVSDAINTSFFATRFARRRVGVEVPSFTKPQTPFASPSTLMSTPT